MIEFSELFYEFDADNTGTVSVEEIEVALRELQIYPRNTLELHQVLQSVDVAGDGEFGVDIFMVILGVLTHTL